MLKQQIQQDLKQALKNKRALEVSVLRMLVSAVSNEEIAQKKKELGLSNEEIIFIISRQIKQRKDSIEQYKKGGRLELAEQEERELEVLKGYLPEQISEQEIRANVKEVVASGISDFGAVIGKVMAELKGQADGSLVRKIVEQELDNLRELADTDLVDSIQ